MSDKTHKFFIVVPPAFERVAYYELIRQLKAISISEPICEFSTGGIELELPLEVGLSLNHCLKIPVRILMRLASQDILTIKDYVNFVKTQNFSRFGKLRKVYASSRTSKLKIKGNLEDLFREHVKADWSEETGTDVYLRFFRDECTISVDTSGEDLYQRGYEKWVGHAPIRDNLAAALLQYSLQGVENLTEWEVVDPMMGSGTFLIEAAYYHKMFTREFTYQKWSFIQEAKHNISQFIAEWKGQEQASPTLRGFDRDQKHFDTTKRNLSELKLSTDHLKLQDLFKASPQPSDRSRLAIVNPPLGKRLKVGEKDLFQKILAQMIIVFQPERIGILVPEEVELEHAGYESVRVMKFSNNGLYLRFFLFLKIKKAL